MYNPYSKGRWHRLFIESDGEKAKLTESDIDGATITSQAIKIPINYKVKNVIYDIALEDGGSATTLCLKTTSTGYQLAIPNIANFTDGYIYVFCEKM